MYPRCQKTRALIHQRLFHDSSEFYVYIQDIANLAFSSNVSPVITVHHRDNLKKTLNILNVSDYNLSLVCCSGHHKFSSVVLGRTRLLRRRQLDHRRPLLSGLTIDINCKIPFSEIPFGNWSFCFVLWSAFRIQHRPMEKCQQLVREDEGDSGLRGMRGRSSRVWSDCQRKNSKLVWEFIENDFDYMLKSVPIRSRVKSVIENKEKFHKMVFQKLNLVRYVIP